MDKLFMIHRWWKDWKCEKRIFCVIVCISCSIMFCGLTDVVSEGGGVTVWWCKSQIVSNEEKVGILGILVIYALPAAGWAGVNSPDTDIDMTKDTFIIILLLLSQMLLLFNINIIISSSRHWLNKVSITKIVKKWVLPPGLSILLFLSNRQNYPIE